MGGDLTFLKNWQSNSLPTGKSFQSNETKFPNFPTPGCTLRCQISQGWTQVRHNKYISKQNSELRCRITKDTCSCYDLLQLQLYVLTIIRVTLRRIQKPLGESPHFVSLNIPFLVKGTKKVIFISLQ